MKKIVLLMHGMGKLSEDEFAKQVADVKQEVLKRNSKLKDSTVFKGVYYNSAFQDNQKKLFKAMRDDKIDYLDIREFVMYSFGDAATLEHKTLEGKSVYDKVQGIIFDAIQSAYSSAAHLRGISNDVEVIILAQSLGCQVISNYIWDSQAVEPKHGIWEIKEDQDLSKVTLHRQKLKDLRFLITTGCNIPIFVSGMDSIQGIYRNEMGYDFKWHNYYDKDDVLGWPLRPMSVCFDRNRSGMSYGQLVTKETEINSGNILSHWNPLSHMNYWSESDFLDEFAKILG